MTFFFVFIIQIPIENEDNSIRFSTRRFGLDRLTTIGIKITGSSLCRECTWKCLPEAYLTKIRCVISGYVGHLDQNLYNHFRTEWSPENDLYTRWRFIFKYTTRRLPQENEELLTKISPRPSEMSRVLLTHSEPSRYRFTACSVSHLSLVSQLGLPSSPFFFCRFLRLLHMDMFEEAVNAQFDVCLKCSQAMPIVAMPFYFYLSLLTTGACSLSTG